jgi:hypothetical protein
VRKRVIQVFTLAVVLLTLAALTSSSVFAAPASLTGPSVTNPYSPMYGHSYRHGAVPTISQLHKINAYQQTHPNVTGPNTLAYGGGIDGIGVTSGQEKVYLVFYGTQWGSQSTDGSGNLTFSSDSAGAAPRLQNMFKGLGTGNEAWSGTMTQYCDGSGVSAGATSCPSGAAHVGYPTGGSLAGVWYDNAGSEPNPANGNQLANEAIKAAGHFGNTSAASNRYAQYVIMSATGTNPDNWLTGGYCAWHDYNGDTTLTGGAASSPYGDIAFTNMPYVLDQGTSCGQNFVNSNGTLDGFTIVGGHEYSETITDQNPAGGWTNHTSGAENGDECAWISSGQGASANVTMGNGSYAMQSTWSNDTNRCDISHATIGGGGGGGNDFSISANPTSLSIAQGSNGSSTIGTAVTSGSASTVSLSASVSPSGPGASLSPTSVTAGNSSTLTVSVGSTVSTGTYTVTVKGTEGSATHSTSVTVTVTSSGGGGGGGITNGGFETGNFSGWTTAGTTSISNTAHSGSHSAQAGGTSPTNGDSSISQTFTAASGTSTLSFWYKVNCPDTVQYDWATATLKDNTTGSTVTILAKTCNTNNTWVKVSSGITAGHSYTLKLVSHDDNYPGDPTYTLYDDVAVN